MLEKEQWKRVSFFPQVILKGAGSGVLVYLTYVPFYCLAFISSDGRENYAKNKSHKKDLPMKASALIFVLSLLFSSIGSAKDINLMTLEELKSELVSKAST